MVTRKDNGTVEFAYFRPTAVSVSVAGEFNGWRTDNSTMRRDDDGWWRIQIALGPGEYRFKYLVDGVMWEADFAAYGVEKDRHFGWTSRVWVPSAHPVAPAIAA